MLWNPDKKQENLINVFFLDFTKLNSFYSRFSDEFSPKNIFFRMRIEEKYGK